MLKGKVPLPVLIILIFNRCKSILLSPKPVNPLLPHPRLRAGRRYIAINGFTREFVLLPSLDASINMRCLWIKPLNYLWGLITVFPLGTSALKLFKFARRPSRPTLVRRPPFVLLASGVGWVQLRRPRQASLLAAESKPLLVSLFSLVGDFEANFSS